MCHPNYLWSSDLCKLNNKTTCSIFRKRDYIYILSDCPVTTSNCGKSGRSNQDGQSKANDQTEDHMDRNGRTVSEKLWKLTLNTKLHHQLKSRNNTEVHFHLGSSTFKLIEPLSELFQPSRAHGIDGIVGL